MDRYTPAERQHILDRLVEALRADSRIAGVLVVGSGAVGFTDDYSDIDLAVVVGRADDVKPAFDDWGTTSAGLFEVLACAPVPRASNIFLYAMLLKGFLELDISFQCLDDLVARRARWQVAWDRTDRIADLMRASWDARQEPDPSGTFCRYMEGCWHYVNHAGQCVARRQLWRAIGDVDVIRGQVIDLAGMCGGRDTHRAREVDDLPADLLTDLADTLVRRVEPVEILRSLRAAVQLFIRHARALADARQITDPPVPETLLRMLLDLWETQTGI